MQRPDKFVVPANPKRRTYIWTMVTWYPNGNPDANDYEYKSPLSETQLDRTKVLENLGFPQKKNEGVVLYHLSVKRSPR